MTLKNMQAVNGSQGYREVIPEMRCDRGEGNIWFPCGFWVAPGWVDHLDECRVRLHTLTCTRALTCIALGTINAQEAKEMIFSFSRVLVLVPVTISVVSLRGWPSPNSSE